MIIVMSAFQIEIEIEKDISIITPLNNQIDLSNANAFGYELDKNLKENGKYILDLKNVIFIDSSGLGKIIAALRFANSSKSRFVICNIKEAVEVLFNMVRLSQIASVYADKKDAISALNTLSGA